MTLARLLVAALLISSLPASAQAQQPQKPNTAGLASLKGLQRIPDFTTASEPWRIVPNPPATLDSGEGYLGQIPANRFLVDPQLRDFKVDVRPSQPGVEAQLDADTTCFAIRSYVVARDSKDSDSTHPAGYSTCRPSDRYSVKSAEIRVETGGR